MSETPAAPNTAAKEAAASNTVVPAISLQNLHLSFGAQTLFTGLDLDVRPGEFFCILGPSGCGKSTLLRVIGDLLAPTAGSCLVSGRPAADAWQDIAFVFQQPRLAPWRTAERNVTLAMELRQDKPAKAEMAATASRLLAMVGLSADAQKYPRMLSGGERQRVAIARALAVEPKIILMDEPFSALDVNTRRRLRAELLTIWRETGKTIVFVTHDVDEALTLADRVVLFSNKPTAVLELLELSQPRPRDVDADPELRAVREALLARFQSLEEGEEAA